MPLTGNISPAGQTPEKSTGPAKYAPARSTPSMVGNTAPIPGVDQEQPQQRRAQAPAAAETGGEQEQDTGADDGEGTGERAGDDVSWRLSVVAKQSAQARQLLKEAKEAQAALKAERAAAAAERAQIDAWKKDDAERRKSPRKVLMDYGYSPEAALQYELAGGKLTPEQQLAVNFDQRLNETQEQFEQRLQQQRQEDEQRRDQERQEQDRQDRERLAAQEELAVQEMQADIGDIITGDPKAYGLIAAAEKRGAGRGVAAIYDQVQRDAEAFQQQNGRWPPITTKMLERAAAKVEAAARKELQETMADPELAATLGIQARPPVPRTQQLTNRIPPASARPAQAREGENENEKRERVKGMLDDIFRRRGGR
jgi:hypothetical protein